jgi:NAD(P)H dehydrogenase (quinone)
MLGRRLTMDPRHIFANTESNAHMNILIVFTHPSKRSYTHQVLGYLQSALNERNWSIEVSDLYAMGFQSDMTEQEYAREGFSRIDLPVADDVQKEHAKIDRADCIIFLYPIWWSDCPAKLKGWFDRVFSVGYAYKQSEDVHCMKVLKYAVAMCTAGYTNDYLTEIGIAQSMENIMLNDRFGDRFTNKEMVILGGTLEVDKVKQRHQEQIDDLISRIGS